MADLDVDPPVPDPVRAAILDALAEGGLRLDGEPSAAASPWRRAAAREAVDNEPGSRRMRPSRYVLSPRSTRGATRA